jgi:hypothetical protein
MKKCCGFMSRKFIRQMQDEQEPSYERLTSFGVARDKMRCVADILNMTNKWKEKATVSRENKVHQHDPPPRLHKADTFFRLFRLRFLHRVKKIDCELSRQ